MPIEAPTKAPTIAPTVAPVREPHRRMDPDKLCPSQKEKVVRRVAPILP